MIRGSCLCGGVAYEIDGRVSPIQLCHARRCRKMSASTFRAEAAVKKEALRFVRGEELVTVYAAPILREPPAFKSRFCKVCGTPVPGELEGTGFAVVYPSQFDEGDAELAAFRHIFVSQNAPWLPIADDLPQFDERPPEAERLPRR
jgi:hypothetical protein